MLSNNDVRKGPAVNSLDLPDHSVQKKQRYDDQSRFDTDQDREDAGRKSTYDILTLNSRRYLCQIPHVDEALLQDDNATLSNAEEEMELARAGDRGWDLLKGMQGNCVYFWSGWWTYRYCYGQGVKQFHQLPPAAGVPAYPPVEDPTVTGFTLGQVEESERKEVNDGLDDEAERSRDLAPSKDVEVRGDTRYLVQRLGGGTECDLTGKDRRIEVQVCRDIS